MNMLAAPGVDEVDLPLPQRKEFGWWSRLRHRALEGSNAAPLLRGVDEYTSFGIRDVARRPYCLLSRALSVYLSNIRSREEIMADDKKKLGRDRDRVAGGQAYEVSYFRRKHGLSKEEALKIINQAGNSRDKANQLAEAAKKRK